MNFDVDALWMLNEQHMADLRRDAQARELARQAEAGRARFDFGSAIKRMWLNTPRLEVRLVRRDVAA